MSERLAYIALGSNLGDRREIVASAIDALNAIDGARITKTSSIIETDPAVGSSPPDQGRYLNAVVEVATTLSPTGLLEEMLAIERRHGRRRTAGERWGPRTLDLDLLLYGDAVIDEPTLTLPHPRMHEREFVLRPLVQIAPNLVHPALGRTVEWLLDDLDTSPKRKRGTTRGTT